MQVIWEIQLCIDNETVCPLYKLSYRACCKSDFAYCIKNMQ